MINRMLKYYPYPWHLEVHGEDVGVWDSRGHILAVSEDDEPEDKAAIALMAHAPELYGLIRTLDRSGALPERTATGYHAQRRFDEICASMQM